MCLVVVRLTSASNDFAMLCTLPFPRRLHLGKVSVVEPKPEPVREEFPYDVGFASVGRVLGFGSLGGLALAATVARTDCRMRDSSQGWASR